MTRVRIVAMLIGLTLRLWVNGLQRSMNSIWLARCVVALPVLLLAAWLVGGTVSLGEQVRITRELAVGLAQPLSATAFALSAIATLFVAIYSAGTTVVDGLLIVLPLKPATRRSLTRAIPLLLGTVIGYSWCFPLAFQFFSAGASAVSGALLLVSAAAVALLGSVFCLLALVAAEAALGTLGVFRVGSDPVLRAVGATLTAVLVAWLYVLAQPISLASEPDGPLLLLAGVLDPEKTLAGTSASLLGVLAACVLGLALISAIDHLPVGVREKRGRASFVAGWARSRAPSMVGLEVRQWLRFPLNLTLLVFAFLIFFALALFRQGSAPGQWNVAAYALLAILATAGVGSYGPTRAHHWIFEVSGRPNRWILAKLVSVLVIGGFAIALMTALLLGLTGWEGEGLDLLLPVLFVELAAGALIGLLLPVGREQSLGNAASEFTAVFFAVGSALLAQSIPGTEEVRLAMQLTLGIGIVLLYVVVARQLRCSA